MYVCMVIVIFFCRTGERQGEAGITRGEGVPGNGRAHEDCVGSAHGREDQVLQSIHCSAHQRCPRAHLRAIHSQSFRSRVHTLISNGTMSGIIIIVLFQVQPCCQAASDQDGGGAGGSHGATQAQEHQDTARAAVSTRARAAFTAA